MDTWVDTVVSKWKTEGVKLNAAASLSSIESTETILDFKFPDDFKEFYLQINGFLDLDWQEHMFHFWPLEKIVGEFDESSDESFIGFCDFFLSCHYIGFMKNQPGIFKRYSIIKYPEHNPLALSFKEVVNMINSSSDLIY
jgi:hypothetical protein